MANEEQMKRDDVAAQLKAQQEYQRQTATIGGGALGGGALQCGQPSLRERLSNRLYRAQEEARTADRLSELQYLLDKHPEVARILELLDQLPGTMR